MSRLGAWSQTPKSWMLGAPPSCTINKVDSGTEDDGDVDEDMSEVAPEVLVPRPPGLVEDSTTKRIYSTTSSSSYKVVKRKSVEASSSVQAYEEAEVAREHKPLKRKRDMAPRSSEPSSSSSAAAVRPEELEGPMPWWGDRAWYTKGNPSPSPSSESAQEPKPFRHGLMSVPGVDSIFSFLFSRFSLLCSLFSLLSSLSTLFSSPSPSPYLLFSSPSKSLLFSSLPSLLFSSPSPLFSSLIFSAVLLSSLRISSLRISSLLCSSLLGSTLLCSKRVPLPAMTGHGESAPFDGIPFATGLVGHFPPTYESAVADRNRWKGGASPNIYELSPSEGTHFCDALNEPDLL
jgi:hypothetical protein